MNTADTVEEKESVCVGGAHREVGTAGQRSEQNRTAAFLDARHAPCGNYRCREATDMQV